MVGYLKDRAVPGKWQEDGDGFGLNRNLLYNQLRASTHLITAPNTDSDFGA